MNETSVLEDRTEAQVYKADPITVVIAGRKYEVHPKKVGLDAEFRAKMTEVLPDPSLISGFVGAATSSDSVKLEGAFLEDILGLVIKLLGSGFDEVLDLVRDYEPSISEDRDYLQKNAYSPEFIPVAIAIWKLMYGPFVAPLGLSAAAMTKAQAGLS